MHCRYVVGLLLFLGLTSLLLTASPSLLPPSLATLGPTRSSHELTITCADVPVAVLAPVPSVAALATVVVLDKIIVRRQVHEAPSLLQSPRQLMLLA